MGFTYIEKRPIKQASMGNLASIPPKFNSHFGYTFSYGL